MMTYRFPRIALACILGPLLGGGGPLAAQPETGSTQYESIVPEPAQALPAVPLTPRPAVLETIWPDSPVVADALPAGLRADEIIGRKVLGHGRAELGVLRDLVIDTGEGKVTYAVVASGGFLGLGQTRRLVPAAILTGPAPLTSDGQPMIPVEAQAWEHAPTFTGDPLEVLADTARRQELDRHYLAFMSTAPGVDRTARGAEDKPSSENNLDQWRLATGIQNAEIRSGDQTIGRVDAVLVDLNHLGALVRLSPRVATLRTSRAFIVPFSQLTAHPDDTAFDTALAIGDFTRLLPEYTGTIPASS